jgi:hypothetical protein
LIDSRPGEWPGDMLGENEATDVLGASPGGTRCKGPRSRHSTRPRQPR